MLTREQSKSVYKYLKRLLFMGKISSNDYDREFGKMEGYPKCCIDYFLRFKAYGLPAAVVTDLVIGNDDPKHQYVRCPKCRGIQAAHFNAHNYGPPSEFRKYMRLMFSAK